MPALIKHQLDMQQSSAKPATITKVRRTRQPRNPQLSVARRNERERNRVKMVNNGFALLREHLPVEDLQACEQSDSDSPTPDGGAPKANNKAKKFSKVETLRAAIQRIRMLEELIRSTEPTFESMNIRPNSQTMAYDEEPLSVCEPLSCSSSHSNSTGTMTSNELQQIQQQSIYTANCGQPNEQFVKLEPQQQQQQQQQQLHHQIATDLPSPHNSHSSQQSGHQQQYHQMTQVHHQHNHHHQQQQHQTIQQQQQHHDQPSHTHLWIQQHQNSFMAQQQEQYQQQQWYEPQTSEAIQQKQSGNWQFTSTSTAVTPVAAPQTTTTTTAPTTLLQVESPHDHRQLAQSQQQHISSPGSQQSSYPNQMESPVWFSNGSPASIQSASQPIAFDHHHNHLQHTHHHHQISLYSQ